MLTHEIESKTFKRQTMFYAPSLIFSIETNGQVFFCCFEVWRLHFEINYNSFRYAQRNCVSMRYWSWIGSCSFQSIINLTLFSRMTLIAFYAPEHNTFNNIFRKKFNFSRTKVRIFCCSNKIQVVYDFFNCERCIRSPILMSRSSAYILFTRVECWTKSYSMLL